MYSFNLTEEIARWAFEVICRKSPNWYIAFTNPTAGPWKTIKGLNEYGEEGEVYRFELEETRPDIILVNDELELVLIVEAKDSLKKLTHGNQVEKSVEVVYQLTKLLKGKRLNQFWGKRASYRVITALLWGSKRESAKEDIVEAYDAYYNEMCSYNMDKSFIFGIETLKHGDKLKCKYSGKFYKNKEASKDMLAKIYYSFVK